AAMYKVLNRYQTGKRQYEKDECTHILKAYWQMKNIEPFVMKIHENEQSKKFQAEKESTS
ncbi:spore coat protein YsxE, partial [Bacillus vallismortis]|nr:spore coat protein YsxE [Bacillus vallismortis]